MPGAPFIMTDLEPTDQSLTATATTINLTPPVQPLSGILLSFKLKSGAADQIDSVTQIFSKITGVVFAFRSKSIINLTGAQLYALNKSIGAPIFPVRQASAANAANKVAQLWVPFGYRPFDPDFAFPRVATGDTTLQITTAADPSSPAYNNYTVTASFLQLPAANPTKFLRATQMVAAPSATGLFDVNLPRAALMCGIGVQQAHAFPASATPTLNQLILLEDNMEFDYQGITDQEAYALAQLRSPIGYVGSDHVHTENLAAAYTQNAGTAGPLDQGGIMDLWTWLELDPLRDQSYAVDTTTLSQFVVRANVTTAENYTIIPLECYTPAQFAIAP